MILVDAATGSNELVEPLLKLGLPVEKTHLESGDLAFVGRGEKGAPLFIGIEYKKLGELVSSLNTERVQGHQLPTMQQTFDRSYMIVVGDFHHDQQGRAVVFKGPGKPKPLPGNLNAVELEQVLFNLQTRGGLITRHVTTERDALRVIVAWYRYWTDKDLDKHKSHLAVYAPDLDTGLKIPISRFRKGLIQLVDGLGRAMSGAVEREFYDHEKQEGSWTRLLRATEKELADIAVVDPDGKRRKLGAKMASKIREALR